jgi:hypothetical protein
MAGELPASVACGVTELEFVRQFKKHGMARAKLITVLNLLEKDIMTAEITSAVREGRYALH